METVSPVLPFFFEFEAIIVRSGVVYRWIEEFGRDVGNGNSVAELGVDGWPWPCDVIRTNLARVFGISAKGREEEETRDVDVNIVRRRMGLDGSWCSVRRAR